MRYFFKHAVSGLVAIVVLAVTTVSAQNYPSRDITFVVPFGPGGAADPISRQFAAQLKKTLGGNVNVENKPGGSSTIGIGTVVRAKPDGYTIGLGGSDGLAYQPLVIPGLPYKTPEDYQSIVKLAELPVILAVRADAPWKKFEDFVGEVRKNPGKMRVAVAGLRTPPDLVIQHFNKVANVKIATVPFSGGGGEALVALLGGRVEAVVGGGVSVLPHVQAGTVRVLAVFKKGRYDLFPDAAPVVDAGYDAELNTMYQVIAPNGLPKDVLDRLTAASMQVVRSEEFITFAKANGYVPDAKGPDGVRAELAQFGKIYADLVKFLDQK